MRRRRARRGLEGAARDWGSAESALLSAASRACAREARGARRRLRWRRSRRGTRATARSRGGYCAAELAERKGWSEETKQSVRSALAASRDALREASALYNEAMASALSKGESRRVVQALPHDRRGRLGPHPVRRAARLTRSVLRIGECLRRSRELNAAWRVIDEDGSGQVTAGEFGKPMRLGEQPSGAADEVRVGPSRLAADRPRARDAHAPRATAASRSPRGAGADAAAPGDGGAAGASSLREQMQVTAAGQTPMLDGSARSSSPPQRAREACRVRRRCTAYTALLSSRSAARFERRATAAPFRVRAARRIARRVAAVERRTVRARQSHRPKQRTLHTSPMALARRLCRRAPPSPRGAGSVQRLLCEAMNGLRPRSYDHSSSPRSCTSEAAQRRSGECGTLTPWTSFDNDGLAPTVAARPQRSPGPWMRRRPQITAHPRGASLVAGVRVAGGRSWDACRARVPRAVQPAPASRASRGSRRSTAPRRCACRARKLLRRRPQARRVRVALVREANLAARVALQAASPAARAVPPGQRGAAPRADHRGGGARLGRRGVARAAHSDARASDGRPRAQRHEPVRVRVLARAGPRHAARARAVRGGAARVPGAPPALLRADGPLARRPRHADAARRRARRLRARPTACSARSARTACSCRTAWWSLATAPPSTSARGAGGRRNAACSTRRRSDLGRRFGDARGRRAARRRRARRPRVHLRRHEPALRHEDLPAGDEPPRPGGRKRVRCLLPRRGRGGGGGGGRGARVAGGARRRRRERLRRGGAVRRAAQVRARPRRARCVAGGEIVRWCETFVAPSAAPRELAPPSACAGCRASPAPRRTTPSAPPPSASTPPAAARCGWRRGCARSLQRGVAAQREPAFRGGGPSASTPWASTPSAPPSVGVSTPGSSRRCSRLSSSSRVLNFKGMHALTLTHAAVSRVSTTGQWSLPSRSSRIWTSATAASSAGSTKK